MIRLLLNLSTAGPSLSQLRVRLFRNDCVLRIVPFRFTGQPTLDAFEKVFNHLVKVVGATKVKWTSMRQARFLFNDPSRVFSIIS